jgi:hypothetical protein
MSRLESGELRAAKPVAIADVAGTSNVTFTDNDLTNNTFGIIVEAAFVRAGTRRRGDITLSTSGNTITGSCQADLLVALSASPTRSASRAAPISPTRRST